MTKYSAYCKNHDWVGMLRDTESEARLDLNAHIELYPSEDHDKTGIATKESVEKDSHTE